MNPSDLTNNSELNRTWSKLSLDSFNNPDAHLTRLWDMAARDSWSNSDMNWDSVDLSSLPSDIKQGVSDMLTQLHYGEVTALLCSARLVQHAPSLSAQLFSSSQVNDEARHVQWFSHLMNNLDCMGEVRSSVAEFMTDIYECESIDGLIIGMHILVEGMAHSFFMEGARLFNQLGPIAKLSKSYRSAQKVLGEWLPNYLGRDESRHIAYGVQFLQQRLPNLTAKERDALEARIDHWGKMFVNAAIDPKLVLVSGMDGFQVADRCIKTINLRLASIGLHTRIPSVEYIDNIGKKENRTIWTVSDID